MGKATELDDRLSTQLLTPAEIRARKAASEISDDDVVATLDGKLIKHAPAEVPRRLASRQRTFYGWSAPRQIREPDFHSAAGSTCSIISSPRASGSGSIVPFSVAWNRSSDSISQLANSAYLSAERTTALAAPSWSRTTTPVSASWRRSRTVPSVSVSSPSIDGASGRTRTSGRTGQPSPGCKKRPSIRLSKSLAFPISDLLAYKSSMHTAIRECQSLKVGCVSST
jgi:hypothetical protein